uniref:Uncharacterized protein n=1 Tax=Papilio xuthus TaxID=66420 RepID=I4DKL2_PAPXU|nr:unknown unsecreted protein [Papilio xuthus]
MLKLKGVTKVKARARRALREDEVPEKKKEIWKAPLKLVKQTLSKTKMADNPATSDTKHNSSTNIV